MSRGTLKFSLVELALFLRPLSYGTTIFSFQTLQWYLTLIMIPVLTVGLMFVSALWMSDSQHTIQYSKPVERRNYCCFHLLAWDREASQLAWVTWTSEIYFLSFFETRSLPPWLVDSHFQPCCLHGLTHERHQMGTVPICPNLLWRC